RSLMSSTISAIGRSLASGYNDSSAVISMTLPSPLHPVLERHAEVARIPEPDIPLLRKIGRLVAEEEAAHRVLLVEQVPRPERDAERPEIPADTQVHEPVALGLLVVRVVEVEAFAPADLEPSEPALAAPVLGTDRVAHARRVRLLAALERREHVELDDLGIEPAERAEKANVVGREPVDGRLHAAVTALVGVLGEEQERRRIAEAKLQRDLDLLIVAARLEHADVGPQSAVEPRPFDAGLEAHERFGVELDLIRRDVVDLVEVDAGERDVEAARLVAAREPRVGRPAVRDVPRERKLAAGHAILGRECVAEAVGIARVAALPAKSRRELEALGQREIDLTEHGEIRRVVRARRLHVEDERIEDAVV